MLQYASDDIYRWDFYDDVGFISKGQGGTEKDAEQDQNIESNKRRIDETQHDLRENEAVDERQQQQIDENYAIDQRQQEQIDTNFEIDAAQQEQIDANAENIANVQGEVTDFSLDGTTFVIKKRKEEEG